MSKKTINDVFTPRELRMAQAEYRGKVRLKWNERTNMCYGTLQAHGLIVRASMHKRGSHAETEQALRNECATRMLEELHLD